MSAIAHMLRLAAIIALIAGAGGLLTSTTPAVAAETITVTGPASFNNCEEGSNCASSAFATFTDSSTVLCSAFTVTMTYTFNGTQSITPVTVTGTDTSGTNHCTVGFGPYPFPEDGTYTVTTTVSHAGVSQSVSTMFTVDDASFSSQSGGTINCQAGSPCTGTVATFVDSRPNLPCPSPSVFTASINFGDGAPVVAGSVAFTGAVAGGCQYTVTGTHTYTDSDSFNINTEILDDGQSQALVGGRANVSPPSPITVTGLNLTCTVNVSCGGVVGTFTDSAGGTCTNPPYSATISWGDGTTTAGTIGAGSGNCTVSGTHTYASATTFTTTIRVTDTDEASGQGNGSATVGSPSTQCGSIGASDTPTQAPGGIGYTLSAVTQSGRTQGSMRWVDSRTITMTTYGNTLTIVMTSVSSLVLNSTGGAQLVGIGNVYLGTNTTTNPPWVTGAQFSITAQGNWKVFPYTTIYTQPNRIEVRVTGTTSTHVAFVYDSGLLAMPAGSIMITHCQFAG